MPWQEVANSVPYGDQICETLPDKDFEEVGVEELLEEFVVVGVVQAKESSLVKGHIAFWVNSDNGQA